MKEFGSEKNNFWQNDSCENLDNFSLIGLLYMHRWCPHGPINSYHSFWWRNLILCLYNVDTLNICMKEFGLEKIILTKWQLWELRQFSLKRLLYMHRWCLHGLINSYHSFWWSNLILSLYNVDTLNICMKEFIIFVCTDSTEIFSKLRSAGLNYNLPCFFTDTYCGGVGGYLISITYWFFSLYLKNELLGCLSCFVFSAENCSMFETHH